MTASFLSSTLNLPVESVVTLANGTFSGDCESCRARRASIVSTANAETFAPAIGWPSELTTTPVIAPNAEAERRRERTTQKMERRRRMDRLLFVAERSTTLPAICSIGRQFTRPMKRPLRAELLKERLDLLVDTFDAATIAPDPLQLVLRYADPLDHEVAGL